MKVISGESYIEHVNPEESESKKTVREELERQEDTLEELLTSLHGDSSAEVIVYRQPGSGQQRLKALFTCVPEEIGRAHV